MKIYEDITQTIGRTPLVRIGKLNRGVAEILAKIEFFNPCGSIKDRIALGMIEAAEGRGLLKPGATIVEATSGNTGIGLACVSAVKGYRLILTMPESMSVERRKLLSYLGAKIELTPASEGMKGAMRRAQELVACIEGAVIMKQFDNPANPATHHATTFEEIWEDTDGQIDVFVAGVGTGGTITGVGRRLKACRPNIRVIAVEPKESPVISGGQPGPHKIQGIGAGFIPSILDTDVIDEVITVASEEAIETARQLAAQEGILAGISCGAALKGALQVSAREDMQGKRIVVILPDTAERYLSTDLFKDIEELAEVK